MRKIVALLPMKANSERVVGKNFKKLAGKPLYRWILETLLSLDEIDTVVINTDARHLLESDEIFQDKRIVIRDRHPEICGDEVSMNRIIADDMQHIDAETYVMTHTTNPLLEKSSILMGLQNFEAAIASGSADSLFGVTKYQTRFYTVDAEPINHDPSKLIRTQDLEPWYEENSCVYMFTKPSFARTKSRIGMNPMLFEIPKLEAIDIDEPEDWVLAEAIARLRKEAI
ncbi:acylneuraminate cytidylyltransferase family protein [Planktomarina temperata]|nr:acylneuraminate cytidylyltransferase family protein [Planktomarina temperata]